MGYIDKVNIKHGTDSKRRFSAGNTLPLISLPHALASFSVQTTSYCEGWFYSPTDKSFEGVRLTHRPSPWVGDFAYFNFMPQSDGVFVDGNLRWSGFRPEETVMKPHLLDIRLLRYGARMRLTPTDSGAVIKLDFDDDVRDCRFAVILPEFYGEIEVDEANRQIKGFTTSHNGKTDCRLKCYFVFSFNCAIGDASITSANESAKGTKGVGVAAGANIALSDKHTEISLAISYLGDEQAEYNRRKDASCGFDSALKHAEEIWENKLSKIKVKGDPERERTFYSCLYRAYLYPSKFYEITDKGKKLHVIAETGEIKEGVMYTNNGFWDTYRTVYPLFSLIEPELCAEFCEAWLNYYDDTGYLPRWLSATENGSMPGTLVEAVLADAAVKGLLSEKDCRRALNAMLNNAQKQSDCPLRGRKCVDFYNAHGYVPFDMCKESVNETLDCAYGDFCISQVADVLKEEEIARHYAQRGKNYRKLFDSSVGFMRAKDSNGQFRKDFDSFAWGRDYTESSAWQASLAVPHDIKGLVDLYGGVAEFQAFVDELFATPPKYKVGGYGEEIHEMTEMAAVDFGQCAISNQPSFHIPYLYAATGDKEKSAGIVGEMVDSVFSSSDKGYPGDEDNGTMACWYIFSTLGFYPLCPGKAEYVVTSPMFDEAYMMCGKAEKNLKEILEGKSIVTQKDITVR